MKFYCEYYDKLNNFVDIDEIVQISKEVFGNNTDEYLMNIYINHNIFFMIRNGKYMREYYEDKYKLFRKWYNELFYIDNPTYYEKLNNKLYEIYEIAKEIFDIKRFLEISYNYDILFQVFYHYLLIKLVEYDFSKPMKINSFNRNLKKECQECFEWMVLNEFNKINQKNPEAITYYNQLKEIYEINNPPILLIIY
jgi:hypothetical protein